MFHNVLNEVLFFDNFLPKTLLNSYINNVIPSEYITDYVYLYANVLIHINFYIEYYEYFEIKLHFIIKYVKIEN